jgi:hypothetical protein
MTFSIMPEFPNILKAMLFTTPAIINGTIPPYSHGWSWCGLNLSTH